MPGKFRPEVHANVIRYRPKDGRDRRLYSPNTDLAHVGQSMVAHAVGRLVGPDPPKWLDRVRHSYRNDEWWAADLQAVVNRVADFMAMVPREDVDDAADALSRSGLSALHLYSTTSYMAAMAALGEVALVAVFNAARDVTPLGDSRYESDRNSVVADAVLALAVSSLSWWKRFCLRVAPAVARKRLVDRWCGGRGHVQARLVSEAVRAVLLRLAAEAEKKGSK